jgi:hypothetical protein
MMRCTLHIVYLSDAPAKGGEVHIGCQFVDLPALSKVQLKSYVARLERFHLAAV